ncbi:MAG: two-component system, OmpR family, copper resistance phosphate regulon response regulator CusR [Actinomycetota bacterium]|jgi:DNA-binding response OmpR family regulator|nr:two-component system, OmpR family, copper resistance phosphate regulon response regulator CusR [Actinomycetota bacterium]
MTLEQHSFEVPLGRSRILLIDDEPRILNFVSRALRGEGFEIDTAQGGQLGVEAALAGDFDLIILDLRMPVVDGGTVLQRVLARKPDQAVLVLSALGDPASKVKALDLGADDYLMKPFSLNELVARVRARLRAAARRIPSHLSAGVLRLDIHRREVDAGTGPIPLAEREFLVLEELMKHAGSTVRKEVLLSSVWGYHFDPTSNVLDVTIRRLRTKLGRASITTVRGEGYRIDVR